MPVQTFRAPAGGLPADVCSFVGHRGEIAAARRLLSTTRLLTLTGPGGVGKTRLALRLATEMQRAFADGVRWVDLAQIQQPAVFADAVAEQIGLPAAASPCTALMDYLADRQLLLVLDTCEDLVDSCAQLVVRLLHRSPGLHVLATSRQPLRVDGESILVVPPLQVPHPQQPARVGALTQYEAMALFLDRAQAAVPSFHVTENDVADIARVCHAVDGLPMAIELAATRLRALSLSQIAQRLTDPFRLLTAGPRTAPRRQRTLRALVDWSHDLCSPDEQAVWARASVFADGFELDAAEAVCALDDLPVDQICDLVSALVDKSILIAEHIGSGLRYRMLATIRAYGQNRLAERGECQTVQGRHRDWYAELAEHAGTGPDRRTGPDRCTGPDRWTGPDRGHSAARLQREHANLVAALAYCLAEPGGAARGLRMAVDLEWHWLGSDSMRDGRDWLARALTAAPKGSAIQAKGLRVAALLALLDGDTAEFGRLLHKASSVAQRLRIEAELAYCDLLAGLADLARGDLAGATPRFDAARAGLRDGGHGEREMPALLAYGVALTLNGASAQAAGLLAERIPPAAGRDCSRWRPYALMASAAASCRNGDTAEAHSRSAEAMDLLLEAGDHLGRALCLEALAWIAAATGRAQHAGTLLGAADAAWHAMGLSPNLLRPIRDDCVKRIQPALDGRALEHAARLGAALDTERLRALGLDAAVTAPSPAPYAGSNTLQLTRREQQVANLVADGMTNREIAATLVIAPRTAEGHVERILAKLGFTSRAQIAAWSAERRSTTRAGGD